jgi:hypothetical protein
VRKQLLIVAVLALLGLAFSACGGGGSDDEDQISEAIETAATTTTDSNCTELETQRFLEQTEFTTGQDAVQQCKSSDPANDAESVEVSNVSVDGDKATADAAITGSVFDGQTLVISLVKEDDQWKLDHVDDIKDFDGGQFARAFAEGVQKSDTSLSPSQARCLVGKLAAAPVDSLKAAVLSGNGDQLTALFSGC